MAPAVHAQRNAIGRRAIDTICVEAVELNSFQAQRPRRRDRMTGRRLFHIGRDDAHFSEPLCCFRQRCDSRAVNAVVVRDQNRIFTNKTRIGAVLADYVLQMLRLVRKSCAFC